MAGLLLPGTAQAADVTSGKTFSGAAGLGVSGSLTIPWVRNFYDQAANISAATTQTLTGVNLTAGDTGVLELCVSDGSTTLTYSVTSVTDSAGNVWSKVLEWQSTSSNGANYTHSVWKIANALALSGGSITIDINNAAFLQAFMFGVAGALGNVVSVSAQASNTAASSITSNPATPTARGQLALGLFSAFSSNQSLSAASVSMSQGPPQMFGVYGETSDAMWSVAIALTAGSTAAQSAGVSWNETGVEGAIGACVILQ